VTAAAIDERFARDARGFGQHVFETAAALRIGRTVYDELRRTGVPRLRTPPQAMQIPTEKLRSAPFRSARSPLGRY
jgi:hypothetical protein